MVKTITFNKIINKNEIKKILSWFINNYGSIKSINLIEKLKETGFDFSTYSGISLGIEDLKIPNSKDQLVKNTLKKIKLLRNKLKKGKINEIEFSTYTKEIWNQTNEILKDEILKHFRQTDLLAPMYIMMISGARGNILQIKQLVGMRGLMVDPQGKIINTPIKNNLKEGLDILEYFISCYGARKGIIDTAIKTANSGYLTRKLVYAVQDQIIRKPDCKTNNSHILLNKKNKKNYYKITMDALIGRVVAKNTNVEKILISKNQDICKYLAKKLVKNKKLFIRSPLTCKLNNGICQLCYGWNIGNGRMAELGETIGILAAQSIGEPGTQLTMRTFHTGGIFNNESAQSIISNQKGTIYYNTKNGGKILKTKYKEKVFLTLRTKKIIIIENKIKKYTIIVPKYTFIFIKNKKKIFKKQIIAEICNKKKLNIKFTKEKKYLELKPIKTTISGEIKIKKNNTAKKENKQILIISANILQTSKINENLKKSNKFNIKKNLNKIKEIKKTKLNKKYLIKLTNEKIIKPIKFNKINDTCKNKQKQNYNIKKILQDKKELIINKAYTTKYINTETNIISGKYIFKSTTLGKNKKNEHSLQAIEKRNKIMKTSKANAYLISDKNILKVENENIIKKYDIILYTHYETEKVKDIIQGLPKIEELLESKKRTYNLGKKKNISQEKLEKTFKKLQKIYNIKIAARKSIYKIQKYLIEKIQSVYTSQGIKISNKHIEVIVKPMTSKCMIEYEGESNLICGEISELNKIENLNKKLIEKITYKPIITGISKLALSNNYISSKCFQKTTTILTKAAIEGKIDWLQGIKENLILGKLIPIGTGYKLDYYNK
jgi:DNA-directed RNA polymerase subunit beta'